ncbi:hypothetical protein CAPTEDRAFT_225563 [Capitella teleta]|uniref:Uncharacterized protein n=1 Tax=Capitella teleta TaxID=283909 RepID=R7U3P9_CAPTE|nr:hypothetical protein CAPTEDRAFT_225563 [Capitella teleta]|eukprot:ELU00614.1 hypothetical protein CAPTEDRAFT_225563 [Capitella teleta]
MGRKTKRATKLAKVTGQKKEKESKKDAPKFTVDELMDKVDEYVDSFEFEIAQRFCQKALEMEPNNIRVIETSGTLLLELGDLENAKRCFCRAIELEPARGHSKYMYMGQISTGMDAINCFLVGIKLMREQLEQQAEQGSEGAAASAAAEAGQPTPADISKAHCNIAEIYLTDACFEPNAEEECRKNLEEAISADAANPEAHHLMASFWLSKDDQEKAEACLDEGISLWLPALKQVHLENPGTKAEALIDPIVACHVSYPGRINAAKLCIEVSKYEVAAEILELLLDEDDEVLEVWYLLGWSNHLQGSEYLSTARFYLQKAQKVAKKLDCDDKQMIAHVEELLEELGPGDEEENGEEEEEEEEEVEEGRGGGGGRLDGTLDIL